MKFDKTVGNVHISADSSRIDGNVPNAQKALNKQIVADCNPLIPFSHGALRNRVKYPEGVSGGKIEYDTPYAHYQYVGQVYGPNLPQYDSEGNLVGWASPPKKYPTGRALQYSTPGTGAEWFEVAKSRYLGEWVRLVDDEMRKK